MDLEEEQITVNDYYLKRFQTEMEEDLDNSNNKLDAEAEIYLNSLRDLIFLFLLFLSFFLIVLWAV